MRCYALASCFLIACAGPAPEPDPGAGKPGMALSDQDKTDDGSDPLVVESRICASGTTTLGMDVSYYESSIDWAAAKAGGIQYAFIRVSDGTGSIDSKFDSNWSGSRAAGVLHGAYQFFRPSEDPIAQADLMIAALGSYTPGDLPPVIDVEVTGGMSAATVAAGVRTWVDRVKNALGVTPIVYTGKYFWRDEVGGPTSFVNNPLWIAQYTSLCPDLPSPWTRWTFWQSSETGTVAGISGKVDLDSFNGSISDLIAFAGGAGNTPPPPPPSTCTSATLDRSVAEGVCVQAASDAKWYACSAGTWVARSSSAGCTQAYAWCQSATLGKAVPPRTCVQAASDHVWYQCDGSGWATPVSNGAGPAGTCSSEHSL